VHDGKTAYGTFTTPNGSAKFPTIIINPGSGAAKLRSFLTTDQKVSGLNPDGVT
jgi:hypothetical protein